MHVRLGHTPRQRDDAPVFKPEALDVADLASLGEADRDDLTVVKNNTLYKIVGVLIVIILIAAFVVFNRTDVVTEGDWIESGSEIVVLRVEGAKITVGAANGI